MPAYDLVIRNGTIVDGSGGESFHADVGIIAGVIAAVDKGLESGRKEIDAEGKLVTPGFVDVHCHYDGHVTWENRLQPSSWHGVTTAIIGNCGVGFAPCKVEDHDRLIRLMDGVEDIPFPVLAEGLPWTWETFPDYLDFLASRHYDMDVGCYVPHAALRVYVMGERSVNLEPASADDIEKMCQLLGEALDAGAMGVATSRTLFHRSSDGAPIPTLKAADEELAAFARVLREKKKGVFQIVEDVQMEGYSSASLRMLAEESGRPLTFSIGAGNTGAPYWKGLLDDIERANAEGITIKAQVMPRAIGMILGHELTLNPFYTTPTYQSLAGKPLEEKLQFLRQPEAKAKILAEPVDSDPALTLGQMVNDFDHMFVLGNPPNYEQPWEASIAGRAKALGVDPRALAYDMLLEGDSGSTLYLAIANYTDCSLDAVGTILKHPDVIPGLGDGGAHAATICDGSYSTFALTHWGRDRQQGKIPVSSIIHSLTHAPASMMGLSDRGLIATGFKADINVIDFERLTLHAPHIDYDLPGGGTRLLQKASGYEVTLSSGVPVYINGEPTGDLPGQLVRGTWF